MKRILLRSVIILVSLSGTTYLADYLWLKYRVAKRLTPFATVTVHRYYAIAEKNNRSEFKSISNEDQTCTLSLLPHLGYSPCWYLRRHTEQQIPM